MAKWRATSEHRVVLGVIGQCMNLVSDVRLDIPCWLLDIEDSLAENTFSANVRLASGKTSAL
jgi:hypothetical protein